MFDLDPGAGRSLHDRDRRGDRGARPAEDGSALTSFCKDDRRQGTAYRHTARPRTKQEQSELGRGEGIRPCGLQAVMAEAAPDRYVVNMAKKVRTGKIFLDYLRNDRMATAVAPLSPRGRPGAPVSMPVTWAQVKPGLDPMNYTIRSVPGLLKKTKAWAEYCESEQPLADAIKRLSA